MTLKPDQQSKIWNKKLSTVAKDIQSIVQVGRALSKDSSKVFTFKGMFRTLGGFYKQFEETVDQLTALHTVEDSLPEFPDSNSQTTIDAVKKYYFEIHAIYESLEPPPIPSGSGPNGTAVMEQTLTMLGSRQAQLPKLEIPTFSGQRLTEWPLFRDTFQSMVHTDNNLSPIAKFHYLIRFLSEPALSVVRSIPLEGDHYEQAWAAVLQQFDKKRKLASNYMQQILSSKFHPNKTTAHNLQYFLSNVAEHVAALKNMKIPNTDDYILFELAIRNLDSATREAFELQNSAVEFPTYDTLLKFIKERHQALLMVPEDRSTQQSASPKPPNQGKLHTKSNAHHDMKSSFFTHQNPQNQSFKSDSNKGTRPNIENSPSPTKSSFHCFICSANHAIHLCPSFTSADASGRLHLLKKFQGCLNCLHPNHATAKCHSKFSCRICKSRHHTDLHEALTNQSSQSSYTSREFSRIDTTASSANSPAFSAFAARDSEILLGTAQARIKDKNGVYQNLRLVLDSGSQLSFVTKSLVDRLGLKIENFSKPIVGVGESNLTPSMGRTHCVISPTSTTNPCLNISAVVVNQITSFLPQNPLQSCTWQQYTHFQLADPSFWIPGPIDMLLGADVFMEILLSAPINPYPKMPSLLNTIFGHVIIGRYAVEDHQKPLISCFATASELSKIMDKFWEVEEVSTVTKFTSAADSYCEEHFLKNHRRLPSGRYEVALPFKKHSPPSLGCSRRQALTRLYNLEHKLYRNPSLCDEYNNFLTEYLELDHMELASEPGAYIIPHHGVFKTGTTSKIRVVFDASAKTSRGSLNDHLYIGPKLQNSICLVLLNFRRHPLVFSADCVKMYRQISIRPVDRKYQHIFWRLKHDEPVKEYELKTVTYGMSCSSFLSHRVIHQLVQDEGDSYPMASKALLEDSYVDDLTTGANTLQQVLELRSQLITLLAKGGFNLSKWCSNDVRILEGLSDITADPVSFQPHESLKILGSQWKPQEDSLSYSTTPFQTNMSKRSILSTIARIYDPLGYLAPVIFQAKIILQETWSCDLDWDDTVPPSIAQSWSKFAAELPCISSIHIPRYLQTYNASQYDVVGFSDASEKGYCACIYLRVRHGSSYNTFLLQAKTKLAPRKTVLTVPRLELCGANLLAQLYDSLAPFFAHFAILHHHFFTDSSIVLAWLKTSPDLLKIFVAHRVSSITKITKPEWWSHVRSEHNPADCGSRGLFPSQLDAHPLWWSGPAWLAECNENWPLSSVPLPSEPLAELKVSTITLFTTKRDFFVTWTEQFSSYTTLIKVLAYVLRFKRNSLVASELRVRGPITACEFSNANLHCIRLLQQHYFSVRSDRKVKDLFASLNVFEDADGLLRVGGRLLMSGLPYPQRHPLLLPKTAHFTFLLVQWFHVSNLHSGSQALHATIMQRYWIPSAKLLIQKVKFKCKTCLTFSKRHVNPYMGNLPSSRFATERAFFNTGVDFAGPLLCKVSSRRNSPSHKTYICIFICFATKAIHLEVVPNLSTEGFLDALERFIARRGAPAQIFSDCGTNFIGAARYLKEVEQWFQDPEIHDTITSNCASRGIQWNWKGVKWHFNPPQSPHFGGLWESGVKSLKTQLYKTIGNQPFTERELATIVTKIEGILNSRPLFPASSDPNDPVPITPAHLLIGAPINSIPEPDLSLIPINKLSRWQFLRQRTQAFWNSWKRDYLNTLQQRRKWTGTSSNLNVGDVVLLKKSDCLPFQWPMGRVEAIHPGSDNIVRVLTIKTASGTYKRSTQQVIPLTTMTESCSAENDI